MGNYSKFIGIDAHKKFSYVNVQDKDGNIIEERKIATRKEEMEELFSKYGDDTIATLESTYNWIFVYETIKGYLGEVKLSDPRKTKAISSAKVKTDKVDAKTLASLLRADLIPEVYVSSDKEREQKDYLRHRYTFVKMRTSLKNKIHAFMTRNGFEPPYTDAFGISGTEYIKGLEWPEPQKGIVNKYLELIEMLNEEVKDIDKVLAATIKETENMRLLKTIPGIGIITAYMISSEIGNIGRFASYKKLVSYSGLVPGIAASADKKYFRKSKDRNKYLQWAFIEAAIPAIKKSNVLLGKYNHIKVRKGNNKAKMTVARKIAEAAYKVLSQQKPYIEGITIRKSAPSSGRLVP